MRISITIRMDHAVIRIGRGTISFPSDMDRVPVHTDRFSIRVDLFAT
jgi:hypothetical protein